MSDSSSADESSDDDLLSSPVFATRKRDRRTERAERSKLDFFDSCLRGSDARADVHRRIASVEEEFKKQPDEEGEGGDGGAPSDSDEGGDMKGGGGGVPGEGSKENVLNQCSAGNNDNDNDKLMPLPSTVAKKSKKSDEEAYWRRIESFAEENVARRTPGTAAAIHSEARRELTDAVSGLVDYSSDMTDDGEGGLWKDGVCGMTREQMRSEAEAKSQGSSSLLGLRPMFRRPAARVGGGGGKAAAAGEGGGEAAMQAFRTREEASLELKSIVASLQRAHKSPKSAAERGFKANFVDPLGKIVRRPSDSLFDGMHYFLLKSSVMSGRHAVVVPRPFCMWMWKLARSSYHVGQQCSTTCFRLVRKFVEMELDVVKGDGATSFRADVGFLKDFCMDDLVACLVNDFGLWLGDGPAPTNDEAASDDGDAMDASKDDPKGVDVYPLKNILLTWMALLRRDLIRIRRVDDNAEDAIGEDASKALVAFTRMGLDPHLYLGRDSWDNTGGETLHQLLQALTSSLVNSTTRQIRGKCEDSNKESVVRWMKRAADRLVDACINLAAGAEGAPDSDDVDGDLPLAMAVKSMCSYHIDGDFALMKLKFAEQALHKCLEEMSDFSDKVKERTDFLCKDWDGCGANGSHAKECLGHAMHALVTAEVAFLWIDEETDQFMNDHPHLLASVLIAGECALVGASIFWGKQNEATQSDEDEESQDLMSHERKESGFTKDEKDAMYEVMANIEDLCDGIKKECRSVIAFPHLRRTKEYLTRFSKLIGGTKGKSSKQKKQKRREQGSLDSYFSRPSISDPFADSQDS